MTTSSPGRVPNLCSPSTSSLDGRGTTAGQCFGDLAATGSLDIGREFALAGGPDTEVTIDANETDDALAGRLAVAARCSLQGIPPQTAEGFAEQTTSSCVGWETLKCCSAATYNQWALRDSNPRPHGCDPCALAN